MLRTCPESFHQATLLHDVCRGPPCDKDWELQCDVITDLQTVLEMCQSSLCVTCPKPTAVSVLSLTRQDRERHLPGASKIVLISPGTEQMSVRSRGCTVVRVGSFIDCLSTAKYYE